MGRLISDEELYQFEHDLLGIVLAHPQVVDMLNFEAKYFKEKLFQKAYSYISVSRELNVAEMLQSDFDIPECTEIVNIMSHNIYNNECEVFAKSLAQIVLDKFKDREVDELNLKRSIGQITRQEWFVEYNRIENLTIERTAANFTKEKVMDALLVEDSYISMKDFPKLSNLLKIETTDVVTIAGSSGFGKSTFALNIYETLSRFDKEYKCHFFNLEVSEKMMIRRLFNLIIRRQTNKKRDEVLNNENELNGMVDYLLSKESYINTGSIDLESLKTMVIQNLDTDKINIVFVDHIGLLDTNNKAYSKTEYDRTTYCMKELRKFALDYNVVLFIVSQFDRQSVKSGNISMHSLKSSGEIENSSTHVLLMKGAHKLDDDGISDRNILNLCVDVGKNRNGPTLECDRYTFYKKSQLILEDR